MLRPRFSLRWLLGSISFLGIGCGLLFYARPITACFTFSATLFVLFGSIPLSVYRRGERRAFWLGFALFGLGYLGFVCAPWQAPGVRTQIFVEDILPTTKLLNLAYEWVPTKPASASMGGMFQMGMGGMGTGMPPPIARIPITEWNDFVIVGHALWTILIAVSGGIIACWCQRSDQGNTT